MSGSIRPPTFARVATSGGYSSKLLTPTTRAPAPSANTISVTAGTSDTTRAGRVCDWAEIERMRRIVPMHPVLPIRPIVPIRLISPSLLPALHEQPQKKGPANHGRNNTDRQLGWRQRGPRDGVARDKKRSPAEKGSGQHEPMVRAHQQSHEVRDDDANETNRSTE